MESRVPEHSVPRVEAPTAFTQNSLTQRRPDHTEQTSAGERPHHQERRQRSHRHTATSLVPIPFADHDLDRTRPV